MFLLLAAKLCFHSLIVSITFTFILFAIFMKIWKKNLHELHPVIALLIATDVDRPRIEFRQGIEDSTFYLGIGPKYLERNFQITTAFCDTKSMEHHGNSGRKVGKSHRIYRTLQKIKRTSIENYRKSKEIYRTFERATENV